ncbi:hypothetical protein [Flavobacterium sp.]|uniref:hypothetical protein n=1 Tax=Flavobacterium sp. TaxID=239 RepID=UPI0039E286C8
MESVLQENYNQNIGKKQTAAILLYAVSILIILSWAYLCAPEEFLQMGSKGIPKNRLEELPKSIRFFYTGFPNVSTLLCYVMLAFSGFLTLKHKNKAMLLINISSFGLLIWLLFLLY